VFILAVLLLTTSNIFTLPVISTISALIMVVFELITKLSLNGLGDNSTKDSLDLTDITFENSYLPSKSTCFKR
jgi:hypothetical protein